MNLIKGIALHPIVASRAAAIKKKVYQDLCSLTVKGVSSVEPIPKKERQAFAPVDISKGDVWADKYGACWFHVTGIIPSDAEGKHVVLLMNIGGEGVVYDDDEAIGVITPVMSVADVYQPPRMGKQVVEISNAAKAGQDIDLWVDCGYNGINGIFIFKARFKYARLAIRNDEVAAYYYDYITLGLLLATYEKDNECLSKQNAAEIRKLLSKSFSLFSKGNVTAARATLKEYYSKEGNSKAVEYTMIGQGHLDLAWLWSKRESKRKAVRTMTNAIAMINRHPEYVFGASQAQMYDWISQSEPKLFADIKKAVKKGNIELQGGMWVESDCNMPSGESLVRQFYYGDKFFYENFGKTSKTVWLPDSFGFPWTLPQIIKGVGKEYFATIKLTWNRVNEFPYQSFYWVAPDGTKVLTHISPEKSYNSDASPLTLRKAEKNNKQKELGHGLIIYGAGDGGSGAGEAHIEVAKRCQRVLGLSPAKFGTSEGFFDELDKQEGIPEYCNELYLEKHQGTYTSHAFNKKLNRFIERNLHTLEWLSAVTGVEIRDIDQMWQTLLFNQFHDILTGTSIARVHKESQNELKLLLEKTEERLTELYDGIAIGKGVSVINPSPFNRIEYLNYKDETYRAKCLGYSACLLVKADAPEIAVTESSIENEHIRLAFNMKGVIISFFDKDRKLELATERGLNNLMVYRDKKSFYDAWDIDPEYVKGFKERPVLTTRMSYIDGVYAVMELRYSYFDSEIVQKIKISDGTTVFFETVVAWKEKHKMLRADFYPTIYSSEAECDIQFGSIKRSTRNETSIEKAQFEVCAHKYVSVENKSGIFALYSDCKYGYRAKENCLSINLLRSPKYPDKGCDMHDHVFAYAMDLPQEKSATVRNAYAFNQPLIIVEKKLAAYPLLIIDKENVVIETIKPLYSKRRGFAARIYERLGIETVCTLDIARPYERICEANMLELNERELTGNVITLKPHEIKTILVETVDELPLQ